MNTSIGPRAWHARKLVMKEIDMKRLYGNHTIQHMCMYPIFSHGAQEH